MPIRPLDMQVMLPKLAKMNQVKPKVVHREQNEQQMAQNVSQQETDKKLKKVNTFEQKEQPKVKNEEKRQSQGQKDKKKKKKNDEDDEKTEEKKIRHLDIRI